MEKKLPKRNRLPEFDYKGAYRYFVTICTAEKQAFFNNSDITLPLISLLQETAIQKSFRIWTYCFMPDHLHVLIEGKDHTSDLKKYISAYKQKSGYAFKQEHGEKLWQVSYYEHVLRKEEDTAKVAEYICMNPVRKGIVKEFTDYPFSGSFEYEF